LPPSSSESSPACCDAQRVCVSNHAAAGATRRACRAAAGGKQARATRLRSRLGSRVGRSLSLLLRRESGAETSRRRVQRRGVRAQRRGSSSRGLRISRRDGDSSSGGSLAARTSEQAQLSAARSARPARALPAASGARAGRWRFLSREAALGGAHRFQCQGRGLRFLLLLRLHRRARH
jgi:hypothetical protein